jgi:photosystem II stability/assembly factor-like uncharacterized protein
MPDACVTTHLILDPASPPGRRILYAAGFGTGVWKSTDDGCSWQLKNIGLGSNLFIWRLIRLPDGTIYLLAARGQRHGAVVDGALFRTRDGADSWEPVLLPVGVNAPNDLAVNPTNPNQLALACWPDIMAGNASADTASADAASTDTAAADAASADAASAKPTASGGAYLTDDGGASWRCIFSPASYVYALTWHPVDPGRMILVTFEGAAYSSRDNGNSWSRIKGFDFKCGHRPIVDPFDPEQVYITTFGGSVWHGPIDSDEGLDQSADSSVG